MTRLILRFPLLWKQRISPLILLQAERNMCMLCRMRPLKSTFSARTLLSSCLGAVFSNVVVSDGL